MIGTPTVKWTCDRCGLFEHIDTGRRPSKWLGVVVADPPQRDISGDVRRHLCPSCSALLTDWLAPLNTCAAEDVSRG